MSPTAENGLQLERTALSWGRTALAIAATSVAIARNLVMLGHEISAIAVVAVGAACVVLTRLPHRPRSASIRITVTAAVTMVLAMVELVWLAV